MKKYIFLTLICLSCNRKINYIAAPNPNVFIIKKIEAFNGQYLLTAKNGKRIVLSGEFAVGDTIHLFY